MKKLVLLAVVILLYHNLLIFILNLYDKFKNCEQIRGFVQLLFLNRSSSRISALAVLLSIKLEKNFVYLSRIFLSYSLSTVMGLFFLLSNISHPNVSIIPI